MGLILDGAVLRHVEYPKFLGVTLDRQLILTQHCKEMAKRCEVNANLILRLSGDNWGPEFRTMRQL